MPTLIVRQGPSAGHRIEVTLEMVLGRVDSEFLQHDTEVSRRHAVLRPGAQGLEIEDLGSSNGTFVNDERIEGSRALRSGDVVRLGQTSFDVEVEAAAQPTTVRETVAPPPVVPPAEEPPPPAEGPGPPPAQPPAAEPPAPPPAAAAEPAPPVARDVPTEPQPPVAPPPGPPSTPPAYGPPPGPPPAAPAYGAPADYATGTRPGGLTAAAIILLIVGIGGFLYNAWDLFLLFPDIELATSLGFGGLLWTLIIIDIVLLIAAVLESVGGIRLFGLSRTGRLLGIVGAIGVIGAWIVFLVVAMTRGLSLNALAWAVLLLSVGGSIVALILLLAAGRAFASRY